MLRSMLGLMTFGLLCMGPEVEGGTAVATPPSDKPKKKPVAKAATTTVAGGKGKTVTAPAKKAPPKKEKEGPSIRERVFALLAKSPEGLTGAEIKEKLELGGIPSLLKDEGVCEKPRIRRKSVEGVRGVKYELTALGKKHAAEGKVDEHAAELSGGKDWPSK